ncbi:4-hydroxy-tetrahydrodipicolinate synthase [bacterium]|nr:4-hydroxy-tetrahydrodipicolinate synthase [bacterium]MBU1881753.1 4-hydroxy-tetrahydrodipicolinate synthase [bacterium]
MFEGLFPALVTPFNDKNEVDTDVLHRLVMDLMSKGVDGFVPLGTTGESPALTNVERETIIKTCVETVSGRMPIIVGTGTNNTYTSIDRTQHAADLGAAGALVICPYYNKPTQDGLLRHFTMVADASPIPLVVYNIPGRTSVNLLPVTLEKLSHHEKIVGVKEASGNLDQMSEIVLLCGDRISLLAGDDSLLLPILACGGKGAISAAGNVVPSDLKNVMKLFFSSSAAEAVELHLRLWPLLKALFIETNPSAVKEALKLMGYAVGEVRPPLAPLQDSNRLILETEMRKYGLIAG